MQSAVRLVSALAVAVAAATASPPAQAVVVERVVAVVGERPILLSELRARAKPFLLHIAQRVPPGPQQTAAESQVFKELIEKMIDEQLQGQAAAKANVTVTADEVDAALDNISKMQKISREIFYKTAARSGLTQVEYREEITRQILEGKMLQLRVKGRVRLTEEDVKAMYERQLREEKKRREYHPAWIVLSIPSGSSAAAREEREALARDLVKRIRKGESFAELAKRYSDDTATRDNGGDLGIRAPIGSPAATQGKRPTMSAELEAATMAIEVGQVTDPVKVPEPRNAGQALVIVGLRSRQPSNYTTYEEAKPEMFQRLQAEILDKAKRKWLDELKSRTHLDVRL